MDGIHFPIHVLLRQESWGEYKGWIAQCLEYDITSQGPSLEVAKERFEETLRTYIDLLCQGELQLGTLKRAPDEYHEQYWRAAKGSSDSLELAESTKAQGGEILLRVA